jgi:hypothetical protein
MFVSKDDRDALVPAVQHCMAPWKDVHGISSLLRKRTS